MAPGQEFSQVRLAKHLGVSRTPLREALRMLQRDHLVELPPNRLVRIANLSVRDAEYIYIARVTLEAVALRIAVPLMTPAHIETLRSDLDEMAPFVASRDYEGFSVPHREFHRHLVELSGAQMADALGELWDRAERYRRVRWLESPYSWEAGSADHVAVVEACAELNVDAAVYQLVQHLARTALTFIAIMEPNYDPAALRVAVRAATAVPEPPSE
jgi:DNA-binding GntR family transcriptional regulator